MNLLRITILLEKILMWDNSTAAKKERRIDTKNKIYQPQCWI
jgi:hypothetical protein